MSHRKPRRQRVVLDSTRVGNDAGQLLADLNKNLIGQPDAIASVMEGYQRYLAKLTDPRRPLGTFLLLGPTGTGKSRFVEVLAESVQGDARAMIKVDCTEFQHSQDVAKIVGSPPGYLGHRETPTVLSQERLNRHQKDGVKVSFVLFDEVEKASDALWNLLLGIMDHATLTLGDNHTVDFSRTFLFLTANLGAGVMQKLTEPGMGFAPAFSTLRPDELHSKLQKIGVAAAKKKFTPEFFNRINHVVTFQFLGRREMEQVLDLEMAKIQARISESLTCYHFALGLTESARKRILDIGFSQQYGCRELLRTLDKYIVTALSNLVASHQVAGGDFIQISYLEDTGLFEFVCEFRESNPLVFTSLLLHYHGLQPHQREGFIRNVGKTQRFVAA